MSRKVLCPIPLVLVLCLATGGFADLLADPSLSIYYSFDDFTDVVADLSGKGHDGVVVGDVTANPDGKRNGAAKFATGSYLDLNGPSIPAEDIPTSGITLAAWVKCENTAGHHAIFNARASDSTWVVHPEVRSEGNFRWLLRAAGSVVLFDIRAGAVTWGEWVHFAGTYDKASGKAFLYINGQLIYEQTVVNPQDIAGNWGLGARVGYNIDNARPFTGLMDIFFLFKRALSQNEILKAMQGEAYPLAFNPNPANGAVLLDTWANLEWSPGDFAVSHNVYFGENPDEVSSGTGDTFRGNQPTPSAIVGFFGYPYPDGLVPGTTYYWRVDEVNTLNPSSPWKGPVWSFSVAPRTAYNPKPADGAESVDLNAQLEWAAGFGAKLHTVYFGQTFDDVNNAAAGTSAGITTYNPGPLQAEKVYYWRVDENDGATTHKGDVWCFTTPGTVGHSQPAYGATGIEMNPKLSWTPAAHAASHQLYFGADAEAVRKAGIASPEYKGNKALGDKSYDPGLLVWDHTYYWRIDEVNNVNPGSPWKGPLWSFTTADFLLVDDFESYNNIDPPDPASNRIFEAWKDGFGTATNGALVGNDLPPYAESRPGWIHGGRQSMPVSYDNKQSTARYSEAVLTLASLRDWTAQGVAELSLWFRGDAANAAERLYVAIVNRSGAAAVVYRDDADATQTKTWTQWVIPLQAFADQGVNLADVDRIAIGVGTRGNTTTPGGAGKMYLDDIRLYRAELVPVENFSFELPGTSKQKGFDSVPGWNTDGPCTDSGVETGYTPTDGSWTAYLMSGDPSVWQLTNHVIAAGDVLQLKVDARITWAATVLRATLYYDDNGARVAATSQDIPLSDTMREYTLSFSAGAVPASVGHRIGIELSNASSGGTWVGLDNVRLEVSTQ